MPKHRNPSSQKGGKTGTQPPIVVPAKMPDEAISEASTNAKPSSKNSIEHPQQPEETEHLECYTFCHHKICSENELTNHRLSWNFAIQGFLFAAYALLLQTTSYLQIKLADKELNQALGSSLQDSITVLANITHWIPLTGILVSLCIAVGAAAAQLAIYSIQKKFLESHDVTPTRWTTHGTHYPGLTGGGNKWAHRFGMAPLVIPVVFMVVWWNLRQLPLNP